MDDEEFQASGVNAAPAEVFDGNDLNLPLYSLQLYLCSTCEGRLFYAPDNPQAHISASRNLYATHGVSMQDDCCETIMYTTDACFSLFVGGDKSLRLCEM